YETEHLTQCSTVLMLDVSWSMPMRGTFFAAKKMALALDSLIREQFPRDNLYVVGFSDYAVELKKETLPHISWNEFVYGTNMQHGFMLSRRLLSKHKAGSRQIIMVTDGEPTAHLEGGRVFFDYPPSPRTLQETLREAKRCAVDGIVINTFMLGRDAYTKRFVDLLTKVNRGRVFYASAEDLSAYVLVDYLSNKRRRVVS
ncbi:MAG: VWA domain-containing protein, partial [Chloroflexota bacterium]|nr:VWA domain-containing protein [Chloroflexota bacterium]